MFLQRVLLLNVLHSSSMLKTQEISVSVLKPTNEQDISRQERGAVLYFWYNFVGQTLPNTVRHAISIQQES